VVEELTNNGCEALTITKHNNTLSCYALLAAGADVLTAAEFSCWVTDFNIGCHAGLWFYIRTGKIVEKTP